MAVCALPDQPTTAGIPAQVRPMRSARRNLPYNPRHVAARDEIPLWSSHYGLRRATHASHRAPPATAIERRNREICALNCSPEPSSVQWTLEKVPICRYFEGERGDSNPRPPGPQLDPALPWRAVWSDVWLYRWGFASGSSDVVVSSNVGPVTTGLPPWTVRGSPRSPSSRWT
jgi:hypothetical protein